MNVMSALGRKQDKLKEMIAHFINKDATETQLENNAAEAMNTNDVNH